MNYAMLDKRSAEVADLAVERSRKRKADEAAADATHHDLALAWRERHSIGTHSPVYTNGAFHMPTPDGLWRLQSIEAVQVQVAAENIGCKLCRKRADYKGIAEHAAALCEVEGFFDSAVSGVVTPAGMHVLTATGAVETVELSLEHRQTFALDWRPDFNTECYLLDRLLADAFEGDDAAAQIDLFWQCVGASLFGLLLAQQQVVLLLGRERSGKSLIQRLVERVFPSGAVAAVSPASWGHEYHVAALAGKRLNVVGELSDDVPILAAPFKNVTGQNLVAGRHPTHRPFNFRCQAAHWFASNVLPPTTDRSEAFYRRWIVLYFANTVPAELVDPHLFEKVVADEMPGLLARAFAGAEAVARAGRVRTTRAHDAVLARWRLAANPLQQFLTDAEWVELDPGAKAHTTVEVYTAYRRWAAAAGFRNPFGRNHFIELLESTGATRGVVIKRNGPRNVVAGLTLLKTE